MLGGGGGGADGRPASFGLVEGLAAIPADWPKRSMPPPLYRRRVSFTPGAAFYCVSDAPHFTGLVALLNSLRIVGHAEPLVVIDCGLEPSQRELLAPHAEVVAPPNGLPPMLQKHAGPLARPADVMAVLDADVIVTRSLAPLLDAAAEGKVVAFEKDKPERFFPEWEELGLGAPRRQPYVMSGHLFAPVELLWLLEVFGQAQALLDLDRTLLANTDVHVRVTPTAPFYYPDMDVLNAVLATALPAGRLEAVDPRLAPFAPFTGIRVVDEQTLRCVDADGREPFLLHHTLRKPWLAPIRSNAYSRLLPRLLLADDVQLRLEPELLPLRLRRGPLARADRLRADVQDILRTHTRGKLGLRPRVAAWRDSRRAAVTEA
jgi:hypothetical protein